MSNILSWFGTIFSSIFSFLGSFFNSLDGAWAFYLGMISIAAIYRFLLKPIFGGGSISSGSPDKTSSASERKDSNRKAL